MTESLLDRPGRRVHIVGIGGVMMSAIARLLARQGCLVSGSDQQESALTAALRDEGLTIHLGHAAANLPAQLDLLAHSSAIPLTNPEVAEALRRGVPVLKRDAVLGEVVNARRGIAIAGTHGKTTTCSLAACVLTEGGIEPTFLIGTVLANYGTNARVGGEWVVVEADEYDRALLALRPEIAVVLNVEMDHPDIYRDVEDLHATFRRFVAGTRPGGLVLLGADSPLSRALAPSAPSEVQTFGFNADADWRVEGYQPQGPAGTATLVAPGGKRVPLIVPAPGRHNALNAAAAVAVATRVGLDPVAAAALLTRYRGAERRLEVVRRTNGITLVCDYAHHPTEVRATIDAAKSLGGRLRVVYEPHQFARTRALLELYADAFDGADETRIVPIYQARETDTTGVDARRVAEVAGVVAVDSFAAAGEWLLADRDGPQTWLLMGAGNIHHLAHDLAARLGGGAS